MVFGQGVVGVPQLLHGDALGLPASHPVAVGVQSVEEGLEAGALQEVTEALCTGHVQLVVGFFVERAQVIHDMGHH